MKTWLAPFLGISLMAAIGWSSTDVSPHTSPPIRRVRTSEGDSSLLGQFQTSASGHLWSYTEVYLQNGIKLRRMTEKEKISQGLNDGNNHGVTIIPDASRDFRGVFGDVERAISPWTAKQNYKQNDPRQCLPLFRLMTWLDPYFVEGWTTGAMVIGMGYKEENTEKALQFLREGLQHNPDCVDIPMMFAMLNLTRRKEYKSAERFLIQAIKNGKSRYETLSENEKSALQNSYRWLALIYRDTGQTAKLMSTAKEGLLLFPDDLVLPSTSRPSVVPPPDYKPPVGVTSRSLNK